MKKMKKFLGIMLAMVMAVTMLAGCGGSSKESSSSDNGKTLKFGCFSYSESLDPANMINSAWCNSRYGIGECLFKYKDDLSVENTICDEYSTEDNKTWVFHIRDGVKFSNGNDVTPSAIKACWDVLYANKTGSSNPSKFMDYESITPDDDARTLTIVLKQAKADLRKDLAYPVFVILDVSGDYDLAENPIGTGPYALTSFDSKTKATLVKNKYYWNGEVPYDNVEIDFLSEDNKALALQNGDINLVENVTSTSDLDTLKKDDNFNVSIGQGVRTGFAYINEKGILGDDTLRQAVQMALDHKTMCEVTVGGLYTEGISVLPSSLAYGYDNLKNPYTYNVDNAKKLLDDAGYKDTDGDGIREMNGKKISINYIFPSGNNFFISCPNAPLWRMPSLTRKSIPTVIIPLLLKPSSNSFGVNIPAQRNSTTTVSNTIPGLSPSHINAAIMPTSASNTNIISKFILSIDN